MTQLTEPQRLKILFKKKRKLIGHAKSLAKFKEPVLIFMRRTGKVEFIENVKGERYEYVHSDGTDRYLTLRQKKDFEYGPSDFEGYIAHEDFPIDFPLDPVIMGDVYYLGIEKTLNDVRNWKVQELKAKAMQIKQIGLILLGIGVLAVLWFMVKPADPTPIIQQALKIAKWQKKKNKSKYYILPHEKGYLFPRRVYRLYLDKVIRLFG